MTKLKSAASLAARYEDSLWLLLGLSGFLGIIWGIATATWQTPIEAVQVMAGLVRYEPSSPVYAEHIRLFTGVNYFLLPILALTRSEMFTSILLCAVIGMIAMQSLALAVFVGVRNVYLALISAVIAVPIHLFGYGIAYPIIFMGSAHANGRLGFFFAVLAVLFFAFSRFRTAFLLCGLTLLVHPSWGVFVGLCLALVLATGYPYLKSLVNRENLLAYFGGVAVSVAVVVIHKIVYPLPRESGVDLVAARKLFSTYIQNWDYHRQRFSDPGNLIRELSYAAVGLVLAILLFRDKKSSLGEKLFAHVLMAATALGVIFVFIPSWFSPDAFPETLIALMPGRFVNVILFLALPLLVGFLLRNRTTIPGLVTVAAVWALLYLMQRFNPFTVRIGPREFSLMLTALVFAGLRFWKGDSAAKASGYGFTNLPLAAGVLALTAYAPFFLIRQLPEMRQSFHRVQVPPFTGKVLTTIENYSLQAQARVPTFTPLLDGFPHTGAGTLLTVQREMRDVYGIDIGEESPRAKVLHRGVIVTSDYRSLWEDRSCKDWQLLARQYQLGLIITPSNLVLRLPRADNDPAWNKYYPRCAALN